MLLTYGDCSKLKGKQWCMLEVRSEKTIEPTLRRIGKQIPAIFHDNAVELFVPVGKRDLDRFDLDAAAYLFVRSTSFKDLLRLKTITGVVSLVTEGDSNRPSRSSMFPIPYVQELHQVRREALLRTLHGNQGGVVRAGAQWRDAGLLRHRHGHGGRQSHGHG